jgi:hypothetical protein
MSSEYASEVFIRGICWGAIGMGVVCLAVAIFVELRNRGR